MPTTNFYKAVNSQTTDEIFVILLTLKHTSLTQDICISSDNKSLLTNGLRGTVSNGVEYTYLPFKLTLPNLQDGTIPACKISIDNIDRAITAALSSILSPPAIEVRIALASDPDVIEYVLTGMKLNDIVSDRMTIEGEFSTEYFVSEPYPSVRFTPSRFPGLFRGKSEQLGGT